MAIFWNRNSHSWGKPKIYSYILWECDSVFDVIKSSRWLWSTGRLESYCSTFSRMLMVTCSLADLAHLVMHCHMLYNLPYPSCAKSRGRELEHSKPKPGCWARQANAYHWDAAPDSITLLLWCTASLICWGWMD